MSASDLRDRTPETAQRLSVLAMRDWEKVLGGALAVPAAAALTTAAAMLFAITLLERTFGLFDTAVAGVGRRVDIGGAGRRVDMGSVDATRSPRWNSASRVATIPRTVVARSASAVVRASVGPTSMAPMSGSVIERAQKKIEERWDVVLVEAGANPIGLIRELRERTGKELRDLEMLMGSLPEPIKRAVSRTDAESLRESIEAAGGRVEMRRTTK